MDGKPIKEKRCVHKSLFPLNGMDYATLVLLVIATALAAGGGIGGGGLLVPIYSIVGGFPTTQATALSLATISGGSIANLWTYTQRYHPNPKLRRPLIDYDASLLFCPALLAGTMFGSMFSVMFPPWLVVVCLVVLLGYSGKRTVAKGMTKWKAQSRTQEPKDSMELELVDRTAMEDDDDAAALEDVPLDTTADEEQADINPLQPQFQTQTPQSEQFEPQMSQVQSARLDEIRRQDASLTPWAKWGYTCVPASNDGSNPCAQRSGKPRGNRSCRRS